MPGSSRYNGAAVRSESCACCHVTLGFLPGTDKAGLDIDGDVLLGEGTAEGCPAVWLTGKILKNSVEPFTLVSPSVIYREKEDRWCDSLTL